MPRFQRQGEQARRRYRRNPVAAGRGRRSERDRWSGEALNPGEARAQAVRAPTIAFHLRADAPIYALIAAHAVATVLLCWAFDATHRLNPFLYVQSWLGIFATLAPPIGLLAACAYLALSREPDLMKKVASLARRAQGARLIANMTMMLGICIFLGCFTNLKTTIPEVGGFTSEFMVAEADRLLHFGKDPWTYFNEIFWEPSILAAIEYNYTVVWFIFMFGVLAYFIFSDRSDNARARFLLCYVATWAILGNAVALLVRAAGPAFYHHVTGDLERFSVILQRLAARTSEHSAASLQNYLWSAYNSKEIYLGGGISAFPSMHVAVAAMNFFFLAEIDRRLGLAALLYLVVILASSVTLGWHYAIDGYVSIGVGFLIYRAVNAIYAPQARALRPIPES